MIYLKKRKNLILLGLFLCLSYNLYFVFLLPEVKIEYLLYLDSLLAVFILLIGGVDYYKYHQETAKKKDFLPLQTIIYREFPFMENYEIAEHDVQVLTEELREQFEANCDLEDYIAKWCHEVKIPLSAALLMIQKIEDHRLRLLIQEQLERMNQQLKTALLGCKVQSSLFDIQIRKADLLDCVKTSIKNNQFFLIKNHFQIEIEVEDLIVYTDKSWLVYMLDQLISNAMKYSNSRKNPVLKIWAEKKEKTACLFVEDFGEGIKACDIRRIFEKGYTGSTHHNGKYKSTGMGLYMTEKIAEKLGHTISVESEWGKYTRFKIEMSTD